MKTKVGKDMFEKQGGDASGIDTFMTREVKKEGEAGGGQVFVLLPGRGCLLE